MQELNPFVAEVARLKDDRESLISRDAALSAEIEWLQDFDISSAAANMEELDCALKVIERNTMAADELRIRIRADIDRLNAKEEEAIRKAVAEVTRLSSGVPSVFNPFNWFGDERSNSLQGVEAAKQRLKAEAARWGSLKSELLKDLARHEEHIERMRTESHRVRSNLGHVGGAVSRYQTMNLGHLQSMLSQAREQLSRLDGLLSDALEKRERVEVALSDLRPQLQELEERRRQHDACLAAALRFEEELKQASSKRDRAIVHDACRSSYGNSRPQKVIDKAHRSLATIDRDIAKVLDRARRVVSVASRAVRIVVFDGSNLCYQNNKFVGIGPVVAAATALAGKKAVVVVFDRSITRLQNESVAAIRRKFDGVAEVHVVQSKRQADETVLNLADAEDSIVVSNDRFVEFPEKKAKRDQRLATHEIVSAKVMIPDLEVCESWCSSLG